jgi:hypothetical protein
LGRTEAIIAPTGGVLAPEEIRDYFFHPARKFEIFGISVIHRTEVALPNHRGWIGYP